MLNSDQNLYRNLLLQTTNQKSESISQTKPLFHVMYFHRVIFRQQNLLNHGLSMLQLFVNYVIMKICFVGIMLYHKILQIAFGPKGIIETYYRSSSVKLSKNTSQQSFEYHYSG